MLFLLDHIPQWVLGMGAGGLAVLAFRFLGLRGALAVGGAWLMAAVYKTGQQHGIEEIQRKVDKGNGLVVKRAKEIADATEKMSVPELDADNSRWIRK